MSPTHIKEKTQYHYDGKLRIPMELHQQMQSHIGKNKKYEFQIEFLIEAIEDKLMKLNRRDKS